jgi:hypothetical protein
MSARHGDRRSARTRRVWSSSRPRRRRRGWRRWWSRRGCRRWRGRSWNRFQRRGLDRNGPEQRRRGSDGNRIINIRRHDKRFTTRLRNDRHGNGQSSFRQYRSIQQALSRRSATRLARPSGFACAFTPFFAHGRSGPRSMSLTWTGVHAVMFAISFVTDRRCAGATRWACHCRARQCRVCKNGKKAQRQDGRTMGPMAIVTDGALAHRKARNLPEAGPVSNDAFR